MKHDNLNGIGMARQMPIPLTIGVRGAAIPDSYFVSGLPNLKKQDDRVHAHTDA